uniref:Uncharacterized protein n=1 Tax=Arundo donax TaxID=35708 RepID=A0A0A9B208_ARUDO
MMLYCYCHYYLLRNHLSSMYHHSYNLQTILLEA